MLWCVEALSVMLAAEDVVDLEITGDENYCVTYEWEECERSNCIADRMHYVTLLATRRRRVAYAFAQHFFIYCLVGLCRQSDGYGGPRGIFGDKRSWACTGLRRVAAVLIMSDSN